jgi:hypothetical protein
MQLSRDISDGRLLKTDLTEQAFRDLDNQVTSVLIFEFSFNLHVLIIPPITGRTVDLTPALLFLPHINLPSIVTDGDVSC